TRRLRMKRRSLKWLVAPAQAGAQVAFSCKFTLDPGLRRDDAATSGFALRFARAHRVSRHFPNSNVSCESVCTCTPVPADCTSTLLLPELMNAAPVRPPIT